MNTGDGGILMAYNDSPTQRTPLSLAYSRDSWHFTKIWDFEIAKDLRFSYPALILAADGTYHLVYRAQVSWAPGAIKHVDVQSGVADAPASRCRDPRGKPMTRRSTVALVGAIWLAVAPIASTGTADSTRSSARGPMFRMR